MTIDWRFVRRAVKLTIVEVKSRGDCHLDTDYHFISNIL